MTRHERTDPANDPHDDRQRKNISVVRIQMVREGGFSYHAGPVRNSADGAGIFQAYLAGADREYFLALMLDQKNRANALHVVSIGSLTTTIVHPREVFKPAVISNAASMILSHNHPSGDPTPSREDIDLTKRLVSTGELLGIKVLDHIIVGEKRFFSFSDEGRILPSREGSWQIKVSSQNEMSLKQPV